MPHRRPPAADPAMEGEIVVLAEGALYALVNPVVLDGRVSWYAADVRGFAPVTSYLLVEGDDALLVDTGLTVHRASLIDQLRSLIEPGMRLRILHTRLGEYDSICNTVAILSAFPVAEVYGTFAANEWVQFQPRGASRGASSQQQSSIWRNVDIKLLGPHQTILLGAAERRVQVFASPLRLLSTHWIYDERTESLLTSDSFSYTTTDTADGPWIVTHENDLTTLDEIRDHLYQTRYWWLAEADAEPIRSLLQSRLQAWPIAVIGPAYGRILQGSGVTARHRSLLEQILVRGMPGGHVGQGLR